MHKPIDEKIIPVKASTEDGDCNCSCSKTTDKNVKNEVTTNNLAESRGKNLIDING